MEEVTTKTTTLRTGDDAEPLNEGKNVTDLKTQASLSEARKAASAASYDIQKRPEDSVERQALHNLLTALEYIIQAQPSSDEKSAQ